MVEMGACVAGGVHGRGRGVHGRGACMAGGVHATYTPGHYEIQLINARAVRILLECILVQISF